MLASLLLLLLLLSGLVVLAHGTSSTFGDKTNTNLHCQITNAQALSELSVSPEKHMYTNYDTGNTYIYNGAAVTMKCKDSKKTFTNAMVSLIGTTDEYKLYKQVLVRCYYSTIIIPDIFTTITQYCAQGCVAPTFPAGYVITYSGTAKYNGTTSGTVAPFPENTDGSGSRYTLTCADGYVRAWMDDGGQYFTCKNAAYNTTQDKLITCAPGCLDLSKDIVPFVRSLAIVDDPDKGGTPKNQVWPGAPYPWGATLVFTCYGGSMNSVDGDSKIYCYKDSVKKAAGDCKDCALNIGWWSGKAPKCKFKGISG